MVRRLRDSLTWVKAVSAVKTGNEEQGLAYLSKLKSTGYFQFRRPALIAVANYRLGNFVEASRDFGALLSELEELSSGKLGSNSVVEYLVVFSNYGLFLCSQKTDLAAEYSCPCLVSRKVFDNAPADLKRNFSIPDEVFE